MFLGLVFHATKCMRLATHNLRLATGLEISELLICAGSRTLYPRRHLYQLLHLRCGGEGCRFKTKRLNLEKIKKWQLGAAFYVQCEKNECKSFVPAHSHTHTAQQQQRPARKGIINDLLEGFESAAHVFVCEGGCGEAPNST